MIGSHLSCGMFHVTMNFIKPSLSCLFRGFVLASASGSRLGNYAAGGGGRQETLG
jgi:hypothetical protein